MRLVRPEDLRARRLEPEAYIPALKELLRKGTLELSVAVRGQEVVEGLEDYWSLRSLGCQLVPVTEGQRARVNMSLESLGLYDEVTGSEARVYGSVLELVRRDRPTPLVMIKRAGRVRLWAKLEWYNPLSLSIKDRTALSLVEGKLDDIMLRGKVYEASSSNTGVAVSALSRIFGFSARLYIPETAEQFGPDMIRAMGQEVVVKGSSTAELRPLVREEAERDGAVFLNQFESYYNPLAHIRWTAKEIDLQSRFAGLRLKAIFATMGTAGHAAGLATYFRARRPEVKVVGVQPAEGSSIPGIRRHDQWPWPLLDAPAEVVDVSDEEAARVALAIARETGLLPGLSGGASIAAALRAAEGEAEEADYIVVIPDHGVKYLRLYSRYLGA
ncbi:MAG: pyridoxal-phosphate dependent enzyme [Acidilobus sp.]|nr:pyridoxal-phosphate dependent enzyme [Acidilobus sp.]